MKQLPGSRTFHVYSHGFTKTKVTILDSEKQTRLYSIKMKSSVFGSKPDIAIHRGSSYTLIGTARFSSISRTIDLQFYTSPSSSIPVAMTAPSLFARSLCFESSIGPLKWASKWVFSSDLILIKTQTEECVARFTTPAFSVSKRGRLELAPGFVTASQKLLDEIVVSGIAISEKQRRSRKQASAASGAG